MQHAARIGVYVAPVIVVHVALVWWLIRAATGLRLPAWLHADQIMAWLYINGGIVAIAAWTWRRRRAPLRRRLWLRGPRARLLILFWLGGSLAWFLLPAVLGDMWAAFRAWLGGW